jgi:hypothetical protein
MKIIARRATCISSLMLCLVLSFLSACTPPAPGGGSNPPQGSPPATAPTKRPATPTATPAVRTVPMPATQTSCPAITPANPSGTRPAVMRPLALGHHNNLVYIYNEVPPNSSASYGHLKRYDVVTGAKVTIATSDLRILEAQVSADGQWILFLSIPDPRSDPKHVAMLQLVRMDGQGLQTLYCFPRLPYTQKGGAFSPFEAYGVVSYTQYPPIRVLWSPDERHVLLSEDLNGNTSSIELLDISTGSLRPLLLRSSTDPIESCYIYIPVKWLNSSQAYIARESRVTCGMPPGDMEIYLLNVSASVNPVNPSWKLILTEGMHYAQVAADSSPDSKQLFLSYCSRAGAPFYSTVTVEPATGGPQSTIYHQEPTTCLGSISAISNTQLLLLVKTGTLNLSDHEQHIGLLATKGSGGLHLLNTLPGGNSYTYALNDWTQLPWSNVSRDGALYSLNADKVLSSNPYQAQTTVYYGSLSGGNPVAVASTTSGSLAVAGWTLM